MKSSEEEEDMVVQYRNTDICNFVRINIVRIFNINLGLHWNPLHTQLTVK